MVQLEFITLLDCNKISLRKYIVRTVHRYNTYLLRLVLIYSQLAILITQLRQQNLIFHTHSRGSSPSRTMKKKRKKKKFYQEKVDDKIQKFIHICFVNHEEIYFSFI